MSTKKANASTVKPILPVLICVFLFIAALAADFLPKYGYRLEQIIAIEQKQTQQPTDDAAAQAEQPSDDAARQAVLETAKQTPFIETITMYIGRESDAIYWLPGYVLRLMPIIAMQADMMWLRWLPYGLCMLLPVCFISLNRRGPRKWHALFLIVPCALALYQAVSIIMVANMNIRIASAVQSLPFWIEALLLLALCISTCKRKRGLQNMCAFTSILMAVLSPLLSVLLCNVHSSIQLAAQMADKGYSYDWGGYIIRTIQNTSSWPAASISVWPYFKAVLFLMYAVIARYPSRPEPKEIQPESPEATKSAETEAPRKSRFIAVALALSVGVTGIHNHYLGHKKAGWWQTICFLLCIVAAAVFYLVVPSLQSAEGAVVETTSMYPSFAIILVLALINSWATVDAIRILTHNLTPADGRGYREYTPAACETKKDAPETTRNTENQPSTENDSTS